MKYIYCRIESLWSRRVLKCTLLFWENEQLRYQANFDSFWLFRYWCTQNFWRRNFLALVHLMSSLNHRYSVFFPVIILRWVLSASVEYVLWRLRRCESDCIIWFHASCVNITDEQYRRTVNSLPTLNSVKTVDMFHFNFQQNLPTPSSVLVNNFICDFCGLIFLASILHLLRLQQPFCGMNC